MNEIEQKNQLLKELVTRIEDAFHSSHGREKQVADIAVEVLRRPELSETDIQRVVLKAYTFGAGVTLAGFLYSAARGVENVGYNFNENAIWLGELLEKNNLREAIDFLQGKVRAVIGDIEEDAGGLL